MKLIIENWRRFLTEGADRQMDEFVGLYVPGKIRLFHYSSRGALKNLDKVLIDPKFFGSQRNSYSMREYEKSTFPRTFWYTDPKHKESMVSGKLFSVDVPAESIYNFKGDQYLTDYWMKHRHKIYGMRKDMEWTNMFKDIADSYNGIYYTLGKGGPPVVAYFKPLEATEVKL